jgi:hypothetical protein
MRLPQLRKFHVLLIRDVATFAWPIVIFSSQMNRIAIGVAMTLAWISGHTTARAKHMAESLTREQMRVRAVMSGVGFSLWVIGLIWGAVVLQSTPMWALLSVFIPVLIVFGYTSVRVKLALEPNIDPTNVGV